VRNPALALVPTSTDEGVELIREWVRTHFGMSFSSDKTGLFVQRLNEFLDQQKLSAAQLLARLQGGDRALTLRLAEVMSTNYTFFFREGESFDFIARNVFPAFARRGARIWCAAASSGDEPYSLAMLANEVLGPEAQRTVKILGTDISERQLKLAEQGLYPAQQLGQLDAQRRQRWMRAVGLGQFEIAAELKQMCTFRRLNLTHAEWPFEQKFDLILVRNILYYFDPPLRSRILEQCFDVAEPGAWLITSLTEPLLEVKTRWTAMGSAIFRKVVS
jgi:chemotaxis protein methyltransferase CheR